MFKKAPQSTNNEQNGEAYKKLQQAFDEKQKQLDDTLKTLEDTKQKLKNALVQNRALSLQNLDLLSKVKMQETILQKEAEIKQNLINNLNNAEMDNKFGSSLQIGHKNKKGPEKLKGENEMSVFDIEEGLEKNKKDSKD